MSPAPSVPDPLTQLAITIDALTERVAALERAVTTHQTNASAHRLPRAGQDPLLILT